MQREGRLRKKNQNQNQMIHDSHPYFFLHEIQRLIKLCETILLVEVTAKSQQNSIISLSVTKRASRFSMHLSFRDTVYSSASKRGKTKKRRKEKKRSSMPDVASVGWFHSAWQGVRTKEQPSHLEGSHAERRKGVELRRTGEQNRFLGVHTWETRSRFEISTWLMSESHVLAELCEKYSIRKCAKTFECWRVWYVQRIWMCLNLFANNCVHDWSNCLRYWME